MSTRRRDFLAGSAALCGASLSPLMNSLRAQAQQQVSSSGGRPLRFVFLMRVNGLWPIHVQPPALAGKLSDKLKSNNLGNGSSVYDKDRYADAADLPLMADMAFSEPMKALEPLRKSVTIMQDLSAGGLRTHHGGEYGTLGGFNKINGIAGPTVDSLLARESNRPFPHLCLGHDASSQGISYVKMSAAGKHEPLPFIVNPVKAYQQMFGSLASGEARKRYETHGDILEFFAEDTTRLRSTLASQEREQLDRYLDGFESIRTARQRVVAMSDRIRPHLPKHPSGERTYTSVARENIDIAACALIAGLTDVVSIKFDRLFGGQCAYDGDFNLGSNMHSFGHGGPNIAESRHKLATFHFDMVARLANRLQAIPEGNGTMLDNTVIVFTDEGGPEHHSAGVNWPLVVVGGGSCLRTGRYYAPGPDAAKGNDPSDKSRLSHKVRLGDLWATLLATGKKSYADFGAPPNKKHYAPVESMLS